MAKYRGRITQDVTYFNDTLLTKDPQKGCGGTNYTAVVDNIIKDKAKLSIVITDDDGYQKPNNLSTLPEVIVVPVGTTHTVLAKELQVTEIQI